MQVGESLTSVILLGLCFWARGSPILPTNISLLTMPVAKCFLATQISQLISHVGHWGRKVQRLFLLAAPWFWEAGV